jgi:TldD protein
VKEWEKMKKASAEDPVVYFGGLLHTDVPGMVSLAEEALLGAEDGELYLERTEYDAMSFDDGRIVEPFSSVEQGFGVRRVNGRTVLYTSGNTIAREEILEAGRELRDLTPVRDVYIPSVQLPVCGTYYLPNPPLPSLLCRSALLKRIDRYARKDPSVVNVTVALNCSTVFTLVVRADGVVVGDVRPMTRLGVSLLCTSGERTEESHVALGGRYDFTHVAATETWMPAVDMVLRQMKDKLRAVSCPSGAMPVVLGPGWAGVLLHEAIGHGLEGDAVWRKTTVFADRIGTRVGSPLVNVVDDGTIQSARGSLHYDDEGTPTERTVLIKDGILVGFMHDRQSARLLGLPETGNGRRESFAYPTQVRMRNTLMLSGDAKPEDIIASTVSGLYMPAFGGGQVDPATGQFVFACELAYKIEGGKLGDPVVGATLIGNCSTVLLHVDMVGNDSRLGGAGTCGKGGQSVPVGIGQPTIRLSGGITVGGTESLQ